MATQRQLLIKFRGRRSQAHMADIYGVTQQAWCRWENGQAKPSVVIMARLEKDIGEPMEKIFCDIFNNKKLLKERNSA